MVVLNRRDITTDGTRYTLLFDSFLAWLKETGFIALWFFFPNFVLLTKRNDLACT